MEDNKRSFNRLAGEESTYLKQHKENPVHWWPYGPDAIQRAKDDNRPIFLSVGYSSCHWCHVMAHETFQNEDVANFLNDNFICIKVDREEHPDIDQYYQKACHLYTQSGGWPLSAFLLPDMRPFFVGTFFPLESSKNMTGFMDLITELQRAYSNDFSKVEENAEKVTETIEQGFVPKDKVDFQGHFPHPNAILDAVKQFRDEEDGGYGDPPKFPNYTFLEWALEQMLEGMVDKELGQHIIHTVECMLMGGIYDHVKGGVHRYTTDKAWLVPHFEKMLYDQSALLRVLAKMSLLYPSPLVFDSIMQTMDYLKTEMLSDNRYFFAAQDADSEGVEGLYFTFTEEEFESALTSNDDENETLTKNMTDLKEWFGITSEGNFHSKLNILSYNRKEAKKIFSKEGWNLIRQAKKALLSERKNRIPPATDSKGVASWNFILLSSLIDVIQYCQIDVIKHMASELFKECLEGPYNAFLVSKEGPEEAMKIQHSTTKKDSIPYLEDYVFFAESQLRIYELTGNHTFKDNLKTTLAFIYKEFYKEGHLYTRAIQTTDFHLYPNEKITPFDASFRSSLSAYIGLVRRASVLFGDKEMIENIADLIETVTHQALKNPLGAGEALRSLSYPDEAYRVIKVPLAWLQKPQFINFLTFFQPRFVLDYHKDDEETWQICSLNACELQGTTLEEFLKSLTPPQKEETKENND